MRRIPVDWCVGARDVGEPRLAPGGQWLGVVISALGASWIELHSVGGTAVGRRIVEHPAPRAGRGLGGGGWTWTPSGKAIVYAAVDGNLWCQDIAGGAARRLTDHGPDRAAQAPYIARDSSFIVYVLDQAEVWVIDRLSGDDISKGPHSQPERLDQANADFCFDPVVFPDCSTVGWQAWNVPDMPWDAARLELVDRRTEVRTRRQPRGALQQPRPLPDGRILTVCDDDGWLNLTLDGVALVREEAEHAGPTWGLGQRSFASSPDGSRVVFTRNERGFGRLCVVDVGSGVVREIARGVHGQLSWEGDHVTAIRSGARTPTEIVAYDTRAEPWTRSTVLVGPQAPWVSAVLAEPEAVVVVHEGQEIHARLYRADPVNPLDPLAQGGDGRLICWLHGGPTDQWQVTFMPRLAHWRSLGWNVLVPDHRGSTGHGRAYQQALRGRWGELDVGDTIAVVRAAHAAGWGRPGRTALIGGSAGGFTVLGALARTASTEPLAAAAVVAYPVTDLEGLAERSHRFERHSTDSLVGPSGCPAMRDRSPVWFAHEIRSPLLVFHGADDAVVPLEQSRVLVERMRAVGNDVELVVYQGEGHGFRDPAHQLDEYARTAAFLAQHIH